MELESEATPAPEAIPVPETDAETSVEGADDEALETEEQAEPDELDKLISEEAPEGEPELADVEYDGKQYKLPPELREALLRHSDYTKKTMAVAEDKKAVAAEREQLDTLRGLTGERMEAVVNQRAVRAEIERIENTPVHGLSEEVIRQAQVRLMELREQDRHWEAYGQQAAQAEKNARDQQLAKDRDAAWAKVTASNKNINDARRSQLAEYISASGGDPEMIHSITDPVVWQVLHDADIGRRFQERERKANQIKAAQETQPAPEVGGKAAARKSPQSESPEEYHKRRVKERGRI